MEYINVLKFSDLRHNRVTVHLDKGAESEDTWHLGLRLKNMDSDEMVSPSDTTPVEALGDHYVKWNNNTHLAWYFGELTPGTHYLVEVIAYGSYGTTPERPYFANFVTPNKEII